MNSAATRQTLRLAARLSRSPVVRRLGVIPAVVACAGITTFLLLSALSLSSAQVKQRDFAGFDAWVNVGERRSAQATPELEQALTVLRSERKARSALLLTQLQWAPADGRRVSVLQGDFHQARWAGKYRLVSGRWPKVSGEVAVTGDLYRSDLVGSRHGVLSGAGELLVVGRVEDVFNKDAGLLLAAPGTWESFDWPKITAGHLNATATEQLYWADSDPLTTARQMRLDESTVSVPGDTPEGWVGRVPIAYRVPAVLLALGAVIAACGIARRHQRARTMALVAIGVSPRQSAAAAALAASGQCILGAAVGLAAGVALGAATRPLVANRSDRVLSPFTLPATEIALWLGLTALACLPAASLFRTARDRRGAATPGPAWVAVREAGQVLLVVFAAAAMLWSTRIGTLSDAMLLAIPTTFAALLVAPVLLRRLDVHQIPTTWPPARRLAARHLIADRWRPGTVVALVIIALGPGIVMPILAASILASENERLVSDVAPGQVVARGAGGGSAAPQADVVRALRRAAPASADLFPLYELVGQDQSVGLADVGGVIMAVDTVRAADALDGFGLTAQQKQTLTRGGILVWSGRGARADMVAMNRQGRESQLIPVAAERTDFDPAWASQYSGLILRRTAGKLKLPTSQTAAVFAGLSDSQASAMLAAVGAKGLDTSFVSRFRPPVPYVLPLGLKAAAAGAVLLLVAASGAVAFMQVRTLRTYANGLLAQGLPRRWILRVTASQVMALIAAGAVLAGLLVVVPVLLVASQVPDVRIAVPGDVLAVAIALMLASVLVTTLVASRHVATGSLARE